MRQGKNFCPSSHEVQKRPCRHRAKRLLKRRDRKPRAAFDVTLRNFVAELALAFASTAQPAVFINSDWTWGEVVFPCSSGTPLRHLEKQKKCFDLSCTFDVPQTVLALGGSGFFKRWWFCAVRSRFPDTQKNFEFLNFSKKKNCWRWSWGSLSHFDECFITFACFCCEVPFPSVWRPGINSFFLWYIIGSSICFLEHSRIHHIDSM